MNLHGGNIKETICKYKLSPNHIIDFSASINPLGAPERLKEIISGNLNSILRYPDPDCFDAKREFSKYLNVSEDCILLGNGSIELIYLIARALKARRALIPIPAFSEYEKAVLLSGAKCSFLKSTEEDGFRINTDRILKNLRRADLIFICNPNNPTGFLLQKEEIIALAKECENRGAFLVVDEVFMDFVQEPDKTSVIGFASKSRRIMVLRSLTKFFAIPGLRMGALICAQALIRKIVPCQYPWSVNTLAQLACCGLLKDNAFIRTSREYMFKERQAFFRELSRIKYIKPYPAGANFIFCKILSKNINSYALSEHCGRKGIIIRDCANFRGLGGNFIRVAVRKKEENAKLINALNEIPNITA